MYCFLSFFFRITLELLTCWCCFVKEYRVFLGHWACWVCYPTWFTIRFPCILVSCFTLFVFSFEVPHISLQLWDQLYPLHSFCGQLYLKKKTKKQKKKNSCVERLMQLTAKRSRQQRFCSIPCCNNQSSCVLVGQMALLCDITPWKALVCNHGDFSKLLSSFVDSRVTNLVLATCHPWMACVLWSDTSLVKP